ncbi:MAG: argininosuccinate lyase [Planctomycetaceae bacterium]|nr:argininosuccinate lyase [Planctomycetaceae bacterium]
MSNSPDGKTTGNQSLPDKAWGGVFTEATDRRVEQFTESVSFDQRLYAQDIDGSVAHARMLADVGALTAEEFGKIESGLRQIQREIERGEFEFQTELEDIHLHIENKLTERLGDVGRKLHTARSRNDQISTDLRLWVRGAIDQIDTRLQAVQAAFVNRCDADFDVILPAYTHTQRAQPVLAPHYWLCYCEKLERDRERLNDCRKRVNTLPLGAAAVAGTSINIDREKTAKYLGFERIAANSIDVSSDRDFALEFAFCLVEIALHLSVWAEEWIWWSTSEFYFIKLPQAFCTGSSIMPQKVNPDVLELIRGKTARVIGNLQSLIVLTKGLPLAYNRDLQEDKEPLFDSFDTVNASLTLAASLIAGMILNREAIAARLDEGYLDATTLMEYLVNRGIPQRTAHGVVGRMVRAAMDRNVPLAKLPFDVIQNIEPSLETAVYDVLGADKAVAAMQSYGSTAPEQVRMQIERWKKKIKT